ncbi:UDP-N-acetylglucosamine 2-epimerase [Candidatus Xianfuyuplasma coldseepsis]|uniref:UDP-N-acetylglucosamine 2-epimerase (Hydrolyzing) n=1 Tax=Candidatus Xianfuyuplasma coldseepsis TaxID=2782163 RepID=A0A7L7KRE8_9MOLU|nr:UDP-N-acetylglucosamine 2-epimerase [Xianfuyuplasma coldseepsis]QMS84524.1 UDP-N-acetylglucosamine 2-epimerase (hydrolyzing) [Xianfuyuplasma coldseepsis]
MRKYKTTIISSNRADYSLLVKLYLELMNSELITPEFVITGSHLSKEFGYTKKQIVENNIEFMEVLVDIKSNDSGIIFSLFAKEFCEFFQSNKPDFIVVLGDRFEMLSIVTLAYLNNIPTVHFHGGELTYGAIDDSIRHAITKLSSLHFSSTEAYANRIIQLGESPKTVFNIGSLGAENVINHSKITFGEIIKKLNIPLRSTYCIATFHPETHNPKTLLDLREFLDVCVSFDDLDFLFTKSNFDYLGNEFNETILDYCNKYSNLFLVDSLGSELYFSLVSHSQFVIGNSSSGILETPLLGIWTINIGARQNGRIRPVNVIDIQCKKKEIVYAINEVLNLKDIEIDPKKNPYFSVNPASKARTILEDILRRDSLSTYKEFHDIEPVRMSRDISNKKD